MKTLRRIVLALGAAAIGYALGLPIEEHLLHHRQDGTGRAGSGPSTPARISDADAIAPVLSALLARGDFRELARLGTLLDALDAAQMGMLFGTLDRLSARDREHLIPKLLAYWTRRDPQAATKWMQPRLARYAHSASFGNSFANFDTDLVKAWAVNAPELALAFARQHASTRLGEILLREAIFSWPDKNETQRFELLRAFPVGKVREKDVVSFFFSWAQTDRPTALAAAASLPPGPERDGGLGEVLARWAGTEPANAFAQAQALGVTAPGLLAMMVKEAAASDPTVAAHWLETQDAALFPQLAGLVAESWAKRDPAAAFAWAQEHGVALADRGSARNLSAAMPAHHAFEIGFDSPFAAALREKPDATLAWVCALPPGADRERFLELSIDYRLGPEKAQPLLAELPPEAAARGAGRIAGLLATRNVVKAREWVESLPSGPMRVEGWAALGVGRTEPLPLAPGPDRDAMLRGMAQVFNAPVPALERALEIGDAALRRRTFDDVFWQLDRSAAGLGKGALNDARAWLETAKVPEEWKQPWRR